MKTNKTMSGAELLGKALVSKKKKVEKTLQKTGAKLRAAYQDADAKWKASPRHQKAQERIKYGG